MKKHSLAYYLKQRMLEDFESIFRFERYSVVLTDTKTVSITFADKKIDKDWLRINLKVAIRSKNVTIDYNIDVDTKSILSEIEAILMREEIDYKINPLV